MRVAKLKLHDGSWKEALAQAMFEREDAEVILRILESRVGAADMLRWHYTKDGKYSVKSRYRVAMSTSAVASFLTPSTSSSWWNNLWKLPIPPKVKLLA